MMGLTDSTYHTYQLVTWPKCIDIGDQLNLNNPFAWEKMVMNMPGT